jgi:nitroreductase
MGCHQARRGGNFKTILRGRHLLAPAILSERVFAMSSTVIDLLLERNSAPIHELKEPAPSDAEIATLIRIASRVPDHGRMEPWRFILYRGEARERVGRMLAELAEKREGPLTEVRREKELTRFSRAPLVVGVVSAPRQNPKIPDWEMQLSGGAAAMNLVIAANAMGYGTNWITNWYAYDEEGRRLLGLAPHERVIGFVHIGTFNGAVSERPRPDVSKLYADYSGPWEE